MEYPIARSLRERVEAATEHQLQRIAATKVLSARETWTLHPDVASKRWVWELFQNAIDTSGRSQDRLEISMELRLGSLIFEHNGSPFQAEEITALLHAGSAKVFSDPGSIGKFGSGFLVTHAISPWVRVAGRVDDSLDGFEVFIDRSGTEEEILANIRSCQEELDRPPSILPPSARFSYVDLTEQGRHIARTGIVELDELLPYIFAFNEVLTKVQIQSEGFSASWTREAGSPVASRGAIRSIRLLRKSDNMQDAYTVFISQASEFGLAAAAVREASQGQSVLLLGADSPKIYNHFPLLESYDAGLPVAIHGPFAVDENRSAHFLRNDPPDTSEHIIESSRVSESQPAAALRNHGLARAIAGNLGPFLAFLATLDSPKSVLVLGVKKPQGPLAGSKVWDQTLNMLASSLLAIPVVGVGENLLPPAECVFLRPVVNPQLSMLAVDLDALWNLASLLIAELPRRADMSNWAQVISQWETLDVRPPKVWDVEALVEQIRRKGTLEALGAVLSGGQTDAATWLEMLLDLLAPLKAELPVSILEGILPDQLGTFKDPGSLAIADGIEESLKDISASVGLNLRSEIVYEDLLGSEGSMRRMLLEAHIHKHIESLEAVDRVARHVRNLLLERTKAGAAKIVSDDQLIISSTRLLIWCAERMPAFDQSARDIPLVSAADSLLLYSRKPSCLLPLEAWPESAREFEGVFPDTGRLSSIYFRVAGSSWEVLGKALQDWGFCFVDFVYQSDGVLAGEVVQKLVQDGFQVDASADYRCSALSYMVLINEVIGRIGNDQQRAASFLRFLMHYVINKDGLWRELVLAYPQKDSPRPINVRGSEWLGRILTVSWVPNPHSGEGVPPRIPR